eukprot:TRINITY_DN44015_c0_g1_i1.p1 TRINITY_DN44015_c0_g1~~TRINITY_DN44015_c0_g1_i1.p1  ORF type:complete len:472 (+),score=102.12 TRINITY_DN44015_c0_g1_i1:58-1473(+)
MAGVLRFGAAILAIRLAACCGHTLSRGQLSGKTSDALEASAEGAALLGGGTAASHRLLVRRETAAQRSELQAAAEALLEGSAALSGLLPDTAETAPIQSCDRLRDGANAAAGASASDWTVQLWHALKDMCQQDGLRKHAEVYLDSRFRGNYERIFNKSNWVDEAYVNYVKVNGAGTYYGRLTEAMVDSVHRFSTRPIVVLNFGSTAPPELSDASRFPRLVLLHAHPLPGISFNFNKLLAVLLAGVKVGVSVDSDMMIGPHADRLFARTKEEVTRDYPYPMLPTHYLDRDMQNRGKGRREATNFLAYNCEGCPRPTMRWGQAHPTWTFWAFPFVGRWLTARVQRETLDKVHTGGIGEDEDLLNVALWSANATKAWCMFQMNGADWVEQNFFPQHPPGPEPFYEDPSRFPEGIPVGFYMVHGEHQVDKVYSAMKALEKRKENAIALPALVHKKRFYANFSALQADNPGLKCTL